MSTHYLKADTEEQLRAALADAGYVFEGLYCTRFTDGKGAPCESWAEDARRHDVDVVGIVPGAEGFHANVTAPELHPALEAFAIPKPATPYRAPVEE